MLVPSLEDNLDWPGGETLGKGVLEYRSFKVPLNSFKAAPLGTEEVKNCLHDRHAQLSRAWKSDHNHTVPHRDERAWHNGLLAGRE